MFLDRLTSDNSLDSLVKEAYMIYEASAFPTPTPIGYWCCCRGAVCLRARSWPTCLCSCPNFRWSRQEMDRSRFGSNVIMDLLAVSYSTSVFERASNRNTPFMASCTSGGNRRVYSFAWRALYTWKWQSSIRASGNLSCRTVFSAKSLST